MIHVNVRRSPTVERDYIVETSTDGAGWKTQYICAFTVGDDPDKPRWEAEHAARIFANGIEYATGERPRMTSCGYAL